MKDYLITLSEQGREFLLQESFVRFGRADITRWLWDNRVVLIEALEAKAKLERARKLLQAFRQGVCPTCLADCAGANPPVTYCPMHELNNFLAATSEIDGGNDG